MMLDFYCGSGSPYAWRVWLALEQADIRRLTVRPIGRQQARFAIERGIADRRLSRVAGLIRRAPQIDAGHPSRGHPAGERREHGAAPTAQVERLFVAADRQTIDSHTSSFPRRMKFFSQEPRRFPAHCEFT